MLTSSLTRTTTIPETSNTLRHLAAALALFCALATASPAQESPAIHDGKSLLTAMHDRYKSTWYDNVAFQENAITINPDGTTKTEVWDEVLEVPGKLRINRGEAAKDNGVIIADSTATGFQDGKPNGPHPFVHMILILGFDVYRQPVQTSIDQVVARKIDLTQIHEEKWDGEDVYVVGAAKGDLKSNQFWVEKKRLLFVRLIETNPRDPQKLDDTRFRDYRKCADAWISARVEFYTNEKNTFNEDYFNIHCNIKIDPAIFDPAKFTTTNIHKLFE
jgi:hypothetical protein